MAEEFTIVVPVYNRQKLICRCLDSIKAQTYRPLHIIVVDNASTDRTFSTIMEWGQANTTDDPGLRMDILREQRRGASAARNCGLKAVDSDKLCFFDSDDVMRPQLVEKVMAAFRSNPTAEMVLWKICIHTLDGLDRYPHWDDHNFMTTHIFHAIFRTQGYAVRRSYLTSRNAWDSAMSVWNDWELGIRLLIPDPEVVTLPEVLVDVYAQRESITGETFAEKAGQWEKTLRRAKECISDSGRRDRDHLMRLIDYRAVILAAHYRREGHRDLARDLLSATIRDTQCNAMQKRILRLCYLYTALGGHGAAYLADPLL